jgi:hypothetical protein
MELAAKKYAVIVKSQNALNSIVSVLPWVKCVKALVIVTCAGIMMIINSIETWRFKLFWTVIP